MGKFKCHLESKLCICMQLGSLLAFSLEYICITQLYMCVCTCTHTETDYWGSQAPLLNYWGGTGPPGPPNSYFTGVVLHIKNSWPCFVLTDKVMSNVLNRVILITVHIQSPISMIWSGSLYYYGQKHFSLFKVWSVLTVSVKVYSRLSYHVFPSY